ncbi:MAG: hypothetical protein H0W84_02915 [Bacteroidetes bacterium]|nr:hypothetical protein [Bacteroidota bacterium]
MDSEFEIEFENVMKRLSAQFGDDIDAQALLFLIGVQELGKGPAKFSKNEKLDVMHIAICTLLTPYGYYEYEGLDKDGWPHWKVNEKLPALKPGQQQQLIKQAIVEYFKINDLVN